MPSMPMPGGVPPCWWWAWPRTMPLAIMPFTATPLPCMCRPFISGERGEVESGVLVGELLREMAGGTG